MSEIPTTGVEFQPRSHDSSHCALPPKLHLFSLSGAQFCPLYCEHVELDLHSPGCYKLIMILPKSPRMHCCKIPPDGNSSHGFPGSSGELGLVGCPHVNLSGPGQGWFLDSLPVCAPGPKYRYSHYLEPGRADTSPGPSGRQPAPVTFLAPAPQLLVQALGRARMHQTLAARSYPEHLTWRAAGVHEPTLQTTPTPLPILDLGDDHV